MREMSEDDLTEMILAAMRPGETAKHTVLRLAEKAEADRYRGGGDTARLSAEALRRIAGQM